MSKQSRKALLKPNNLAPLPAAGDFRGGNRVRRLKRWLRRIALRALGIDLTVGGALACLNETERLEGEVRRLRDEIDNISRRMEELGQRAACAGKVAEALDVATEHRAQIVEVVVLASEQRARWKPSRRAALEIKLSALSSSIAAVEENAAPEAPEGVSEHQPTSGRQQHPA